MKRRGLLNKHLCKKIQISPNKTEKMSISSFPIISLWKLKAAIATRVLIRLEQKTQLFVPPTYSRRDVPVGVPLDLSTPTGMSCIGTYGENCKSDHVSKYRVLLVAFLLLWHEN